MLHIVNVEEIQGLLLRIPELIQDLEEHDPEFCDSVKEWMTKAEQILVNNGLAVAATVAALRGVLISAERGVVPAGLVLSGQATRRKIKDAAAADVLRKAEEIISSAIKGPTAQIAEGERLIRQIVALAWRKGIIPGGWNSGGHTEMLNAIWSAMSADPELGPAVAHVTGLVGAADALVLLDRVLPTMF